MKLGKILHALLAVLLLLQLSIWISKKAGVEQNEKLDMVDDYSGKLLVVLFVAVVVKDLVMKNKM